MFPGGDAGKNLNAIAVIKNRCSAGIAPAAFRYVFHVWKKTSGV